MAFMSARNRLSLSGSSSLYAIYDHDDRPVCGFLNRKAVTDSSGKKSKDRQWQTLWCQLKETKIEFYKVNGINLKPNGEPPPRDIYPPPNRHQSKSGFLELDNVVIEIDVTSQKDKDLDKRRKHLFRLVLNGKVEYLFQAPSENQLLQWITNIKRTMFSEEINENETGGDLHMQDVRIKASRCSINKKSKHNTNSVRVIGGIHSMDDDECDGPGSSGLTDLDPRLLLLKKRLQDKRELVRQMQKMLASFSGNIECLYKEVDSSGSRNSSNRSVPQSSSNDNIDGLKHSGSDTFSNDGSSTHTLTTLLEDYYMLPGAEWSLVKKGEQVDVLGRLPNGWYRCRALRDVTYKLEKIPSTVEEMNALNDENDNEDEDKFVTENQDTSPTSMDENDPTASLEQEKQEEFVESLNNAPKPFAKISHRLRTDSYLQATSSDITKPAPVMRKDSYKLATGSFACKSSFVDSLTVLNMQQTRHMSLNETHPFLSTEDFLVTGLRIKTLINTESKNDRYDFPLVGAIPPSILQHFVNQSVGARPSSLTSDYGSSAPVTDENIIIPKSSFEDLPVEITLSESFDSTMTYNTIASEDTSSESSLSVIKHQRAASLPGPALEQLEEENNLLNTSGLDKRISLSEAPSPELYGDDIEDMEFEEPVYEEINDKKEYKEMPKSEKRKSRELKVIPSPTNSLERNISGLEAVKNSPKRSKSKRSHSEELAKGGLLKRIRSNILGGHKKKNMKGLPYSNPDLDVFDDMRPRVTSISGKAMRTRGMTLTFGDDSSSESESEESPSDDTSLTPSSIRKEPTPIDTVQQDTLNLVLREPLMKTASSPVPGRHKVFDLNDNDDEFEIKRTRTASHSLATKNVYEKSKYLGYIQAPPKRIHRQIYLDPTQKKHGFNLISYELHSDQGKLLRVIVQHVTPGSPAFVAGLYPGDQILKVNQKDYSQSPVSEIVKAIQNTNPNRTLELVVAFVDGVKRSDLQAKGEEYKVQLRDRQNKLNSLISPKRKSQVHSPSVSPPPTPTDENPWYYESLSDEENSLHIFPYDRQFNKILTISYGDITKLSCDMLVMPLRNETKSVGGDEIHRVLKVGGDELMDELCLAEQCSLGENIITSGHNLPAQVICHAVFGNSDEDVISCCRSALEMAYEQSYNSIVFWIEGFTSSCVSPQAIISTVRSWLEEGDNRHAFKQIVFNIPLSPAIINLIERYFPLEDYERNEKIEALNYCTDSEDEDSANSTKEMPTPVISQETSSQQPPPIPPKPKPKPKLKTVDSKSLINKNLSELDDIMNELNSVVASLPQ